MSETFDDGSFWDKVINHARAAGKEVIEKALWLYYAAQQPDTPAWAKTAIYGALAYLVIPVDAIPDLVPAAGYTDDLGTLAVALGTCAIYINKEVKELAAARMPNWFD